MNHKLVRALVRLYPRRWRHRYGREFEALLEESPTRLGNAIDVLISALGERIFPTKGGEMTVHTSQLKAWSQRAPWAVFGIAPVTSLAVAYSISLFILWSGWRMFLPDQETPFVPVNGWAAAYFLIGRVLYFFAPNMVGLIIAWVAARPGLKSSWPVAGMALISLLSGAVNVRTQSPAGSTSGHVWMALTIPRAVYAAEMLAISVLAYLLLRLWRERTRAA